jgi:hypothetical protein
MKSKRPFQPKTTESDATDAIFSDDEFIGDGKKTHLPNA